MRTSLTTNDRTTNNRTTNARRVTLARHRSGTEPAADLVAVDEVVLADPGPGEVLIRTDFVQVTAVMADLMRADPSLPMPGYELGAAVWGAAIGEVVASGEGGLPLGTAVLHMQGWQDHVIAGGRSPLGIRPSSPRPGTAGTGPTLRTARSSTSRLCSPVGSAAAPRPLDELLAGSHLGTVLVQVRSGG